MRVTPLPIFGAKCNMKSDEGLLESLSQHPQNHAIPRGLLGGQESKCQVDVSQRKKRIGQNQPKKHGQNDARITAYRIYGLIILAGFVYSSRQNFSFSRAKFPQRKLSKCATCIRPYHGFRRHLDE